MPVFPPETPTPGSPGSLIVDDYQYELGGVLLGHGTPFKVEKVTGLLGHAETRGKNIDRANGHGSIPGLLLFSERTIQFDLILSTQYDLSSMEDMLDDLSNAFQPPKIASSMDMDVFAYKRPGRAKRQFFCRGTRFDIDSDFNLARGLGEASVEIVCSDPISYALDLSEESLVLGAGVTNGNKNILMAGNLRNGTPPLIYIGGPATNPIVQNVADDNRAIRLEVVLASNQTARIDVQSMEVAVKTGAGAYIPDYDIVRNDNQFWNLMPGTNQIVYNRTGSSTSSTLTVQYYDAWSRG